MILVPVIQEINGKRVSIGLEVKIEIIRSKMKDGTIVERRTHSGFNRFWKWREIFDIVGQEKGKEISAYVAKHKEIFISDNGEPILNDK